MTNHYGYSDSQWENGKQEILGILRERAAQKQTISYGELCSQLTTILIDPHDYALGSILGQISKEEDECGRGMLSVIVVHKDGDQQPGKGFYEYAAELGRDISDRDRMWVNELNRVFKESSQ